MRPAIQKLIAATGGIAIFLGSLIWAFGSSWMIAIILDFKVWLASEFENGDAVYKKFSDIYNVFAFVGISLSAGLSFALLTWERRPRKILLEAVYWIILSLTLPMSILNYWSSDIFVSQSQQVVLNVILCFLGVVCLTHLLYCKTASTGARTIKGFAIFFLSFQAVFVPDIY